MTRRLSKKMKQRFNEKLHRLAFEIEQNDEEEEESEESESEEDDEEKEVEGQVDGHVEGEQGVVKKKKYKNRWNILITGGSGHLAENLVKKLVWNIREEVRPVIRIEVETDEVNMQCDPKEMAKNYNMKVEEALNRKMKKHLRISLLDLIPPNDELLQNHYAKFIRGSFTDMETMKKALRGIHTVFHLAAVGMTGQFATNRKACMDINAVGTVNLLSWCRQQNVKRFIYSSSIGVLFSGKPLNNVTEKQKHAEKFYNYYCESKAHAEIIVQNASDLDLKTTVLRFNGIYGPGEKRVTERVVNFMLSGWWIGICKPNGVEAKTQLSSVDNCVQGLVRAEIALRDPDSKHGQIYNIMDSEPVGTFSFWTPLNRAFGFSDRMIPIPPKLLKFGGVICQIFSNICKKDPFINSLEVDLLIVNNTFSIRKACRELGYKPFPSSMPEIIEMYKNKENTGLRLTPKVFFSISIPLLLVLFYYIHPYVFWIICYLLGRLSNLFSMIF